MPLGVAQLEGDLQAVRADLVALGKLTANFGAVENPVCACATAGSRARSATPPIIFNLRPRSTIIRLLPLFGSARRNL
jgi:hypothetical protein